MKEPDRVVLVVSADGELNCQLIAEAHDDGRYQLPIAISVEQARARLVHTLPTIIFLDESAVESESLDDVAREFACTAPVIVLASPERQHELAELVSTGHADFVAHEGNYLPLLLALLDRGMRWTDYINGETELLSDTSGHDFLEFLRHEINNPLTGILGNAEMLLARRDRLPAGVAQRLETIAGLAVRLREGVRRLSSGSGRIHQHVRST